MAEENDIIKTLRKTLNETAPDYGIIGNRIVEVVKSLEMVVSPFSQVQKSAIELAKAVGLSSKSIMSTSTRLLELNKNTQLSMSYNISNKEILGLRKDLLTKIGRNVAIDEAGTTVKNVNGEIVNPNFDSELENLIAASKVFDPRVVSDIVGGFDKLGMSMKTAAKYTGKLFQEASEYGINLTTYTENFTNNLDMAQRYNFRNGINGLREMARKATEIRQDMKQIAAFADKVGSVTGAVETASQLQVLGGSFASLANPLAMLNESLTNPEALQDRFTKMTENMAFYDQASHQIKIDPADRLRIRRAAEAMGVDPNNLIDQAYAQARRKEITNQMQGFGSLSPELQKLLPNVGTIDTETGVAGATINGEFKSIAEINSSPELQKQLIEETRSESDDIKVIAKSVMGIEDIVSGKKAQVENEAARATVRPGVYEGRSAYDTVLSTLLKDISPKLIEGAGNIDTMVKSLEAIKSSIEGKFESALFTPFAETTAEAIVASSRQSVKDFFGDNDFSNVVSDVVGGLVNATTNLTTHIDSLTDEIKLIPWLEPHTAEGPKGREVKLEKPKDKEPNESIAIAARDVTVQTRNFSSGQDSVIKPNERAGEMALATSVISNTNTEAPFVDGKTLEEYLNTEMSRIFTNAFSEGVVIKGNNESIPSEVVKTPTKTDSTTTTNTQDNNINTQRDITINLNGTFTFEGDKGRITTKEINRLFKEYPQFATELNKTLKDALTERLKTL